jgi:hypothetical protein
MTSGERDKKNFTIQYNKNFKTQQKFQGKIRKIIEQKYDKNSRVTLPN